MVVSAEAVIMWCGHNDPNYSVQHWTSQDGQKCSVKAIKRLMVVSVGWHVDTKGCLLNFFCAVTPRVLLLRVNVLRSLAAFRPL